MHIVQLVNFHSPTSGGIRVALAHLADGYIARGHRCTQFRPGPVDSVTDEGGLRVVTLKSPLIPGLGGYRMILDRGVVLSLLRADPPDVIELSDKLTLFSASSNARSLGVPVVLFSHERLDRVIGSVLRPQRLVDLTVRRYNRRLMANVDAIVCASEFAAEEFAESPVPIHRVSLGVDLDTFRPFEGLRTDESEVVRLAAAVRLSPEKNPEILLDMAAVLQARGRRVSLDIFGSGQLEDRLRQRAESERLPVAFHGHVGDRRALAQRLSAADVVLAPGSRETFGLAALEAMACGVPVVVPNAGALPELVVGDAGVVAEPTGLGFARAVEQLVTSVGFPEQQRRAARVQAERHSWCEAVEQMLVVHHSVLEHVVRAA